MHLYFHVCKRVCECVCVCAGRDEAEEAGRGWGAEGMRRYGGSLAPITTGPSTYGCLDAERGRTGFVRSK